MQRAHHPMTIGAHAIVLLVVAVMITLMSVTSLAMGMTMAKDECGGKPYGVAGKNLAFHLFTFPHHLLLSTIINIRSIRYLCVRAIVGGAVLSSIVPYHTASPPSVT